MGILNFNSKDKVVYATDGVKPQILYENDKVKVIVAGLEPGQRIPEHPESLGVYCFLEGSGVMLVNGERLQITAGTIIITPDGASRGMEAHTRLSFMATRVV